MQDKAYKDAVEAIQATASNHDITLVESEACDLVDSVLKVLETAKGDGWASQLREANYVRRKEWCNGQELSLSYLGNELAGEVGELCNVLKKLERESLGMIGSKASMQDLKDEAGDVIICLDAILNTYGISLRSAAFEKFNKTSDKYGIKTKLPTPPKSEA